MQNKSGFTLVELLIVIALIAILAVVAFTALNPEKRFKDSRDSVRFNDVTSILGAIKIHQVDNGGDYLYSIEQFDTGVEYMISNATTSSGCNKTCDVAIESYQCVNLIGLVNGGYLGEFPVSPDGDVNWNTTHSGYYVMKNSNGSITVGACESENQSSIDLTK